LSTIVDKPTSESQVRPLAALEPAEQKQAWTAAVAASDGKQPTAKVVAREARKVKKVNIDPSRTRPLAAPELTHEQQARVDEAEKDSASLWRLKSEWRKAGKKDKAEFRQWIEAEDTNQKPFVIRIDQAMQIWERVKATLDKISAQDPHFNEVMTGILLYAKSRLASGK
jgi:hypothetical protein